MQKQMEELPVTWSHLEPQYPALKLVNKCIIGLNEHVMIRERGKVRRSQDGRMAGWHLESWMLFRSPVPSPWLGHVLAANMTNLVQRPGTQSGPVTTSASPVRAGSSCLPECLPCLQAAASNYGFWPWLKVVFSVCRSGGEAGEAAHPPMQVGRSRSHVDGALTRRPMAIETPQSTLGPGLLPGVFFLLFVLFSGPGIGSCANGWRPFRIPCGLII